MKVLVIEDNKADQRLLQEMFRDMNMPAFELVFTENLTKGIAYLDSEDIGIVILDLGLPESQGLDTFLRLKEHAQNISVIVLTGLDDTGIALNALKEGAQDYLIKGWISTEILKKSVIYAIERQRLIEELRQSNREILFREERFRTLIEENADAMVVLSKTEGMHYQNPAAELLFEGAPADYLKIPSFSLFDGARSIERTLDYPSGIKKIIEIRGVSIEWERLPAFLLTIRDITERKLAEEKIERLNRVLRALRNVNQLITKENNRDNLLKGACDNMTDTRGYSSAWIALFDDNGTLLFSTESGLGTAFLPVLERLQRGELTECGHHVLRQPGLFIKDPSSGCADCPLATTRAENVVMAAQLEYGTKTYGMLVVSDPTNLTPDVEEQSLFQELVDDIAFGLYKIEMEEQRKQAEEDLLRSEERFRELADSITDVFFAMDKDLRYTYWNSASEKLTGFPAQDAIGKSIHEIFADTPETRRAVEVYQDVLKTKQPRSFENEYNLGGKRFYFDISVYPTADGIAVITTDITEHKKSEESLHLRDFAIESSINAIALADLSGNLTYVNPEFLSIWGYEDKQEVCGRSVTSFWKVPDEAQQVAGAIQAHGTWSGEMVGQRKDGTPIPVQFSANLIRDTSGTPIAMMGSFTDITERKRTEMELVFAYEKLKEAHHLAHIGTWDWVMENDIVMWSEELYNIAGMDHSLPAPTYAEHPRVYTPASWDRLSVAVTRAITTGEPYNIELELIRPDGSIRWTNTFGDVKRDGNQKIIGLHGVLQDITERKRAEEEIRALNRDLEKRVEERTAQLNQTLGEKETLLKEIHHRVKNNLQIIASLLNLQSQYVKDEPTLAVIKDSQNRIKAMALIHEKIYQSKSLDRIDYGDYLEKITRSLFESYGVSPKKIAMKIHAENIGLHIDKAIPCSLVINELLSNSFKHAFPNDRTGEVRIDVQLDGDTLRLIYSDNGIGLPEHVTLDHTGSLGMRLIAGLTQQLKGTVEIQRRGGTTFVIAFNV